MTIKVGETASIEATVTPDTAPQTVTAAANSNDIISIGGNR
ncbi:hypothetical protein [Bifidobacterium reuteri]|nr:hypothetical protein [Bifidobacterium reuteri]